MESSSSREHRREQLRQAQRRSRQRRQDAIDRLTEENRVLNAELDRLKASISELVDIAWDRWTTGEISNELLGRLVALNQAASSGNSSGQTSTGESSQWPRINPNITPSDSPFSTNPNATTQTQGESSAAEASSLPFAETPLPSVFQEQNSPYALATPPAETADEDSAQPMQIAQIRERPQFPYERRTVSLTEVERSEDAESRIFLFHNESDISREYSRRSLAPPELSSDYELSTKSTENDLDLNLARGMDPKLFWQKIFRDALDNSKVFRAIESPSRCFGALPRTANEPDPLSVFI